MCVMISLSNHFLTTDVKAIGQWSFRPVAEEHLGTWTIVVVFTQMGTEANDSEVLKNPLTPQTGVGALKTVLEHTGCIPGPHSHCLLCWSNPCY